MAGWVLIQSLQSLFAAIDDLAPERDHTTDGSIGDPAHAASSSDHNPDETGMVPIHDADSVNEVHAIDVDKDLNESDLTMEKIVQFLLGRCRSGAEKRLRYIIYNRRIWEASNGWNQRDYTGSNPHDKHAHFSASYDTKLEANTASWHLKEIPVAITDSDMNQIRLIVKEEVGALIKVTKQVDSDDNTTPVGRAVIDFQEIPNRFRGEKTGLWVVLQDMQDAIKALAPPPSA